MSLDPEAQSSLVNAALLLLYLHLLRDTRPLNLPEIFVVFDELNCRFALFKKTNA